MPRASAIAPDALWIDLLNPTAEERRKVNAVLGIGMPTRADMEEIEISSRLYQEDGGLFMTAMVLAPIPTPTCRSPTPSPSC